jgi:hypothetical protein
MYQGPTCRSRRCPGRRCSSRWLTRSRACQATGAAHAGADARDPAGHEIDSRVVALVSGIWYCDFLLLLCSFIAVHAAIPWDGVLLAYDAAQIVTSLPVIPEASASSSLFLAGHPVGWTTIGVLPYLTRASAEDA